MTDPTTLSAAELDAISNQLKKCIRAFALGGCRLLSEADDCTCPLCAVDAIHAQARRTEAAERKIQRVEALCEIPLAWTVNHNDIRRALAED